jgi:hypothetical protein
VNDINGKQDPSTIDNMPIAYSRTGPGVKVEEHVIPMIHKTIEELEKIGRKVKSFSSDLAFGSLIEKHSDGKAKTLIALQYDVWAECRKSGKKNLVRQIEQFLGQLSKLNSQDVLAKMKMVKFTSQFEEAALWEKKDKIIKPDLSQFNSPNGIELQTSHYWAEAEEELSADKGKIKMHTSIFLKIATN